MKYLLIFSLFFSTTVIAAESSWRTDTWKVLEIVQAFLSNELSEKQFSEKVLSLKQSIGEESKQITIYQVCQEKLQTEAPSLNITPGFNCKDAKTPTDYAICANQQLKIYDLEMSFLYFKKLSEISAGKKALFEKVQDSWRNSRNSCGANESCLVEKYQQRIFQLK